ncbi:hypothetical protein KC727_02150 [Candidatus Kaiserbacteria bacterium]|nr:hypothetical protein [Candidatus Kaiserbacteria bacterium]
MDRVFYGVQIPEYSLGTGNIAPLLEAILNFIWFVIHEAWWLVLFFILFRVARSAYLYWKNLLFLKKHHGTALLEINIPREITKNARGMEQVLLALHGLGNSPDTFGEKYLDGEVPLWFTLEIVSFGGEVHFYIRCQHKQRNLIEAAFVSYYPDVEIIEVDDYMQRLPQGYDALTSDGYEMFGTELVLQKEACYPIKTYLDFEVPDEDIQLVDPISTFLEILSKVNEDEFVGIQLNISPGPRNWADKYKKTVKKLRDRKSKTDLDDDSKDEEEATRSPGQLKVLKAVEEKISRPIFNSVIRFVYISPKETYYDTFARKGITGAFGQYSSLDLNGLGQNQMVATRTQIWFYPWVFPVWRRILRQKRVYRDFIQRRMPDHEPVGKLLTSHILNWSIHSRTTELSSTEIATLFHPPTNVVLTAPHIKRVESKKAGPPAGLSIFSEEDSIDKYL